MKKEEILLQAIGMLPDEMVAQEETKETRHVFLHKAVYVLAVAACFAVIITCVNIWGNHNTDNISINGSNDVEIILSDEDSINFFVLAGTDSKSYKEECQDGTSMEKGSLESTGTDLKKAIQDRTVKLQVVIETENSSTSKKVKGTEYIVFGMDKDFYFTIPEGAGKTYTQDKTGSKKHFVKGKEALCKAGGRVYFDISGMEDPGSLPAWDKKNIGVIASTEIYKQEDGRKEKAGTFYIGIKLKNNTGKNKERNVYYGIFKTENSN